jgi:hypothetical protein
VRSQQIQMPLVDGWMGERIGQVGCDVAVRASRAARHLQRVKCGTPSSAATTSPSVISSGRARQRVAAGAPRCDSTIDSRAGP